MASHHHHHHHTPPPPTTTHNCCSCHNPSSYTCCTPPPPHHPSYTCCTPSPPQHHHLLQAIASLLSQPQPHPIPIPIPSQQHYTHQNLNRPTQNHHLQHQPHSTISSLLDRIEILESSLNHYTHHSLSHAAARLIQTHFRSFLARRSRTLSQLKHLASIKSTFNALKSSFSSHIHVDFAAISLKVMNLLLELDSIQGCDPMIMDGKRSMSRDLVQFLDSIEEVALKKHVLYVKAAKPGRSGGNKVQKHRNSEDDERRKLLQNLRGRVEKLSRLCKVSANDEEDSESKEGIHDNGVTNVLISGRNEVPPNKNGVFLLRQGAQPGAKKSVRFAENRNICEVYSGDVACSDGSCSSSDEQGDVLENVSGAVEDDSVGYSQGAEDDEKVLVVESGGSPRSSDDEERNPRRVLVDDGERNTRRVLVDDGRNVVKEQLPAHREKLLFSAPLPLKMENRSGSMNSKGLKNLT